MAQDELHIIAGKALADPEFREKLLTDPETAVVEAGIELTPAQMEALKGMDREQFNAAMEELDERLTMACWARYRHPLCAWE
jgi:hypothetical protein